MQFDCLEDCAYSRGTHRGRGVHDMINIAREVVAQSVADRIAPSGSEPSVLAGFVLLLYKAAVSMWMRSTDSEGLSRRLEHNNERNTPSKGCAESRRGEIECRR